ncbi:hypothetical protein [Sphingomonas solaris]|uniref:Uncharacterized protein n=1 Tax=Alterirhizorhabdus solaris TaxID=2529389 RepID=A0A558R697_9SPHN|nr:hypothetical protein [Sphingomonas solaris]TVV74906.1 hypothetical protein FOY91_08735 [Sphingomonas solaris]
MNDSKSRALLTTALHPSSSPNERLMALAAFNRMMEKAGLHASDIAIVDVSGNGPRGDEGMAQAREAARREAEIAALARRVKAQEKALREAGREAVALRKAITALEATLARREDARDEDACQIAALEADLAARDRRIAALEVEGGR